MPKVDNATGILKEARDRLDHAQRAWASIYAEGAQDMRYVAGDPWSDKDKEERKELGRPTMVFDEVSQHINQLVNDVRKNKRAIRITAKQAVPNVEMDELARVRAEKVRAIEYRSNAQASYATAFENAVSRSFGWIKVGTRYISDRAFEQEPTIESIVNPENVLSDPDAKNADDSDAEYQFYFEWIPREEYKRKWPQAEIKDFTADHLADYPQWIRERDVRVAEYWKVKHRQRVLLMLGPKESPTTMFEDEVPAERREAIKALELRRREVDERSVCQYILNGVEVLDYREWAVPMLPFVPVRGKELWLGGERKLLSLVRAARDPYMYYCFLRSNEAEIISMSPKVPWIGFEGQFDTQTDWSNIHKVPMGYAEVKARTQATGDQVLPLPQRNAYEPPIQAFEFAADSAKRSVQAAMGRYNTSVGKADTKASSGIAIERLQEATDQGSFHFIDNYDRALTRVGEIINALITALYDTPREEELRAADDTYRTVKLNQRYTEKGQERYYPMDKGDWNVTISTGPNFDSQREEASAFADTLAKLDPSIFARIADLVVKLKNLGPMGDEIAKRLAPPDAQGDMPPQAQAALQQQKQQLEALNAYAQKLEGEIKILKDQSNAKIVEMQSQERRVAMQERTKIITTMANIQKEGAKTILEAELARLEQQIAREQERLRLEHEAATASPNGDSAAAGA